ncbi:hypothetical protein NL436_27795, partial [Klebsiella pneumoniae]|nr:hypothetical protein [Klebsiella pneumoniae]
LDPGLDPDPDEFRDCFFSLPVPNPATGSAFIPSAPSLEPAIAAGAGNGAREVAVAVEDVP